MHFQKRKRGRKYSERRAAATETLGKEEEEKEQLPQKLCEYK